MLLADIMGVGVPKFLSRRHIIAKKSPSGRPRRHDGGGPRRARFAGIRRVAPAARRWCHPPASHQPLGPARARAHATEQAYVLHERAVTERGNVRPHPDTAII